MRPEAESEAGQAGWIGLVAGMGLAAVFVLLSWLPAGRMADEEPRTSLRATPPTVVSYSEGAPVIACAPGRTTPSLKHLAAAAGVAPEDGGVYARSCSSGDIVILSPQEIGEAYRPTLSLGSIEFHEAYERAMRSLPTNEQWVAGAAPDPAPMGAVPGYVAKNQPLIEAVVGDDVWDGHPPFDLAWAPGESYVDEHERLLAADGAFLPEGE